MLSKRNSKFCTEVSVIIERLMNKLTILVSFSFMSPLRAIVISKQ